MTFKIYGRRYDVNPEQLTDLMANVEPDHRDNMRYFVIIGKHRYPIKQVISRIVNLPTAAFNSQMAYSILTRLGLEIEKAS